MDFIMEKPTQFDYKPISPIVFELFNLLVFVRFFFYSQRFSSLNMSYLKLTCAALFSFLNDKYIQTHYMSEYRVQGSF